MLSKNVKLTHNVELDTNLYIEWILQCTHLKNVLYPFLVNL